ncbi:tRNA-dihydrouridine synthase [PVC group bacterium]|nr:tRNA-dihydrouridine synthase [PVC group bacterium]
MNGNFWNRLKKPIFAMAPMADVTDAPFRRIIAKYGKPDILFTEFVSTDGLCSPGKEKLLRDLIYSEEERPIVAQIFGKNPEKFYETAKLIHALGFDGVDINMGCPDRRVCRSGAGASLIENPALAKEIIIATQEGSNGLPVSVKTRMGYHKNELETWVQNLLETQPAAITIHLRTKKDMSKVDARWDEIVLAVALAKDEETLIIGNGDIQNLKEARDMVEKTGVDGVMLGRAIFGNPWLFNPDVKVENISFEEKMKVLLEHAAVYEEVFQGKKKFAVMRKHFKAYVAGFPGSKELRGALEKTNSFKEVKNIIADFRYIGKDFEVA